MNQLNRFALVCIPRRCRGHRRPRRARAAHRPGQPARAAQRPAHQNAPLHTRSRRRAARHL